MFKGQRATGMPVKQPHAIRGPVHKHTANVSSVPKQHTIMVTFPTPDPVSFTLRPFRNQESVIRVEIAHSYTCQELKRLQSDFKTKARSDSVVATALQCPHRAC
jgi:hypothetical protein